MKNLLGLLLPWTCPGCDLSTVESEFCSCGALFQKPPVPLRWIATKPRPTEVFSEWSLTPPSRHLLYRIKYRGEEEWLSSMFQKKAPVEFPFKADVLCPVPTRLGTWLQRGFNPSEQIARHLGRLFGLKIDTELLKRDFSGPHQVGLGREERLRNLRGRFHLKSKSLPKYERVTLIDDVVTTGATLSECTRLLLRAGYSNVACWTLFQA